ncbi:MAG: YtxH domain-containing protein [Cyclobacteriaceae bacterium]
MGQLGQKQAVLLILSILIPGFQEAWHTFFTFEPVNFFNFNYQTMKIISGLLAGALAGVATGILLAPDKGKKTQKRLGKRSNKWLSSFEKSSGKGLDQLVSGINRGLGKSKKKKSGFSLKYFS